MLGHRRNTPISTGGDRRRASSAEAAGAVGGAGSVARIIVFRSVGEGSLPEAAREFLWQNVRGADFEQSREATARCWPGNARRMKGFTSTRKMRFSSRVPARFNVTSLTDCCHPAIRVKAGLRGELRQTCGCGRAGPALS